MSLHRLDQQIVIKIWKFLFLKLTKLRYAFRPRSNHPWVRNLPLTKVIKRIFIPWLSFGDFYFFHLLWGSM